MENKNVSFVVMGNKYIMQNRYDLNMYVQV